jgi:hypothetical protein
MSVRAFCTVYRTTEQRATSPPTCDDYVAKYVSDPKSKKIL